MPAIPRSGRSPALVKTKYGHKSAWCTGHDRAFRSIVHTIVTIQPSYRHFLNAQLRLGHRGGIARSPCNELMSRK